MDESLAKIVRNIEDQMQREKARAKLRNADGDRRLHPGTPPMGIEERRSGQERRNRARSPRAKDDEEK